MIKYNPLRITKSVSVYVLDVFASCKIWNALLSVQFVRAWLDDYLERGIPCCKWYD